MKNLLTCLFVAVSLIWVTAFSHAGILVVNDVDSINTSVRPGNLDLFESARAGAGNILWMDGGTGYNSNYRHTSIQNYWSSTLGLTLNYDASTNLASSLAGVELIVYASPFVTNPTLNTAGANKLGTFYQGGGNIIYITQVNNLTHVNSHNSILSSIGTNIRLVGNVATTSTFSVDPSSTLWFPGINSFILNGVNEVIGGDQVLSYSIGQTQGIRSEGSFVAIPESGTLPLVLCISVPCALMCFFGMRRGKEKV